MKLKSLSSRNAKPNYLHAALYDADTLDRLDVAKRQAAKSLYRDINFLMRIHNNVIDAKSIIAYNTRNSRLDRVRQLLDKEIDHAINQHNVFIDKELERVYAAKKTSRTPRQTRKTTKNSKKQSSKRKKR